MVDGLTFFLGGLIVCLLSGFPVAFSFLLIDVLSILVFMGVPGLKNVTLGIFSSLSIFTVTPVPLFILMGELMFHSHVADIALNIMDRWLGRVPGRRAFWQRPAARSSPQPAAPPWRIRQCWEQSSCPK